MSDKIKFTGFEPEHVGQYVTDIYRDEVGEIVAFNEKALSPISVQFKNQIYSYTAGGYSGLVEDRVRILYFGNSIKVEVTGEEIPEPKLICPVCGVEHDIEQDDLNFLWGFNSESQCPFYLADFHGIDNAKRCMKNLIKAMGVKK